MRLDAWKVAAALCQVAKAKRARRLYKTQVDSQEDPADNFFKQRVPAQKDRTRWKEELK